MDGDSRNVQHAGTLGKYTELEPNTGGKEDCCEIVITFSFKIHAMKGATEHNRVEKFACSVNDYMKWRYAMNSPSQLGKCKSHFSTSVDLDIISDSSIKINTMVNNAEHAIQILKKVKSYIITSLGVVLTIEGIKVEGRAAAQLNESFGVEIAYAEAINDCVNIVFPTSGRELVNKHISECSNSMDTATIKHSVKLKKVLYNFKDVLEKSIETKDLRLSVTFEMQQDHMSCLVCGPKQVVRGVISDLKNMEASLKERAVHFTTKTKKVLHRLKIEEILNETLKLKHPACVLQQTEQCVSVYCFNTNECIKAAQFVGGLIIEATVLFTGELRENKKAFVDHLQNKYGDRIVVDVDSSCRVFMVGLKEAIEEAQDECVEAQEGRVSLMVPKLQPEITEGYKIRTDMHFRFIDKSHYSKKIADHFKVNLAFLSESYIVEISGSVEGVRAATECIEKLDKDAVTDSVLISQARAVSYLLSDSGTTYMHQLERGCDVLIEKQIVHTLSNDGVQVSKEQHDKYITWSTPEGTSLILEHCCFKQLAADCKIIPIPQGRTRGHELSPTNVVAMAIPEWIEGSHSISQTLNDIVSENIANAGRRMERSIAISLTPVSNWTFNGIMHHIVSSTVKWLLTRQREMPCCVKLCTNDITSYSAADTYIDQHVAVSLKASRHTAKLKTVVRKAHLDQTRADVLVNTTSQNLDLSKGKVSAALLNAAGPSLQKECTKQHPKGIDYYEVAVTDGYNLHCKQVFHITLSVYSDGSAMECIQRMRNAMLSCLKTASDYGYKTIAFPALGTGALGYPLNIVTAEMFGCIERFKEHNATLEEVQFVIYPKDEELFQYFEKIQRDFHERQTNPTNSSSWEPENRAVRISITGMKQNVDDVKSTLNVKSTATTADEDDVISDSITDLSRTKGAAVKELHCDDMMDVGVNHSISTDHHRGEERMDTSDNGGNTATSGTVLRQPIRQFSWSKHSKNMQVYQWKQLIVKVYEADILTVPVDGIVNAANSDLQHYGGVAHAIAKAAGEALLRESDHLVQNNGPLQVTSVVRTCAGDLPYKCVLHAVGPSWSDYRPITKTSLDTCEQDLMETIINCFSRAEANGLTMLAIPAISSGIFSVPKDVCAIQYARAVMKYGGNNTLKEIHFVDQDHEMIDIIHTTFDAMIKRIKLLPYNTQIYIDTPQAATTGAPTSSGSRRAVINAANDRPEQRKYDTEKENSSILVSYVSDRVKLVCTFVPAYKLEIYDGDLMTLSGVDAIVCGENKAGEGKGIIAKLLLQKGGKKYKSAKASQFTSWRNRGDVITTPGGGNSYRWIMHAVLSLKDQRSIASAYRNIFIEASTRELTSVALSLLGTGIGYMDPMSSADMLFRSWIEFCQHHGNGRPLALHLVINDKPTADAVKCDLKRQIDDMKQTRVNVLGDTMSNTITKDNDKKGEKDPGLDTVVAAEDHCVICMDRVIDAKKLQCGHSFCTECIEGYFRVKQVCPTCGKVCGVITGDQPDGIMEIIKTTNSVSGYDHYKTITIKYQFNEGTQGVDHPKPGAHYKGIARTGYLPDNKEGQEICAMLTVAFQRRLIFTIGTSRTTGEEGVITWNDIHHKTNPKPNTQFGYPDSSYLQRVGEELQVKGVSMDDIEKMLMKQMEQESYRHTFTSQT